MEPGSTSERRKTLWPCAPLNVTHKAPPLPLPPCSHYKKNVCPKTAATSSSRGDEDSRSSSNSDNNTDNIASERNSPFLLGTQTSELSLRVLADTLERGAKWGHTDELLSFIRGEQSKISGYSPPPITTAGDDMTDDALAVHGSSLPSVSPSAGTTVAGGGLPLLLAALEGSTLLSAAADSGDAATGFDDGAYSGTGGGGTAGRSHDGDGVGGGEGVGGQGVAPATVNPAAEEAEGGDIRPSAVGLGLTQTALRAAVSAVRTCTRVAPVAEQEALLSSLLSKLLVAPSSPSPLGIQGPNDGQHSTDDDDGTSIGGGGGGDSSSGSSIAAKQTLLPALAAVMGTVSCESPALAEGGAAAGAVPALLAAGLAEGGVGLGADRRGSRVYISGGGGADGGGGRSSSVKTLAASAPCCQCLAAVLNKLARGSELDLVVKLVVDALKAAFGESAAEAEQKGTESMSKAAMEVEGEGEGRREEEEGARAAGVGPVQCLAWTLKAVAMRGGLGCAFGDLLDLLCGLLLVCSLQLRV